MTFTKEQREIKRIAQEKKLAERKVIVEPLLKIAVAQHKIEFDNAIKALKNNEKQYLDLVDQIFNGELTSSNRFWYNDETLIPLTNTAIEFVKGIKKIIDSVVSNIEKLPDHKKCKTVEEAKSLYIGASIDRITHHFETLEEISIQLKLIEKLERNAMTKIYDIGQPKVGITWENKYEPIDSDFDENGKPNERVQKLLDNASEVVVGQ